MKAKGGKEDIFATKRPQKFIGSFDRPKDDLIAVAACCNWLIIASFHTGSAESFIHTITQRNKVIAKLQCPSFFFICFEFKRAKL